MGMKTTGLAMKVLAIRVTETDRYGEFGEVLVRGGEGLRGRRFILQADPVIEPGETKNYYFDDGCLKESYRGLDKFLWFEFELKDRRIFWRRDKDLARILETPCAFELWTHLTEEGRATGRWIHWVFPYSTWEKVGYGRYVGRSHDTKNGIKPDDLPDTEPISSGGWWKTNVPPPS